MSLAHAHALPHRLIFSLPSPLPPGFWSLSSALSGAGNPPPQSPSAYKPCLIASSLGKKNQNKEVPGLGVRFQVPGHTPALPGAGRSEGQPKVPSLFPNWRWGLPVRWSPGARAAASLAPLVSFVSRVQGGERALVPLEDGRRQSACMLGSGDVMEGPRPPPPPASSPESLGQPAGLTLEPSAKSSCCSSVSQSCSDPFLPPTQVPPPPGGGGVPEITLHLPYKRVGVGASAWRPGPLPPSSMGGGKDPHCFHVVPVKHAQV